MDGGDGDDLGVVRCGILIITRILMNDVNPEGGGGAAHENPIDIAIDTLCRDLAMFPRFASIQVYLLLLRCDTNLERCDPAGDQVGRGTP